MGFCYFMTFYTFSKIKRRIGHISESKKIHFFLQKSKIFFILYQKKDCREIILFYYATMEVENLKPIFLIFVGSVFLLFLNYVLRIGVNAITVRMNQKKENIKSYKLDLKEIVFLLVNCKEKTDKIVFNFTGHKKIKIGTEEAKSLVEKEIRQYSPLMNNFMRLRTMIDLHFKSDLGDIQKELEKSKDKILPLVDKHITGENMNKGEREKIAQDAENEYKNFNKIVDQFQEKIKELINKPKIK